MIKTVVASFSTIGVLTVACLLAATALAQGKKDDAFGTDVSAQCAQMKDPRVKDDCVRRLRGEAQIGSEKSWQAPASSNNRVLALDLGRTGAKGRAADKDANRSNTGTIAWQRVARFGQRSILLVQGQALNHTRPQALRRWAVIALRCC